MSLASVSIYQALSNNTALTVLWLVDNLIGVGNGEVLKYILEKNKTLRWINMQGNSLEDEDAKPIAEGLRANTTLETLTLSSNSMTDTGKRMLRSERDGGRLKRRF